MKTLRFILFIPVCVILLAVISWLFMNLLNWTIDMTNHWYNDLHLIYFVLLIPVFWGLVWLIFKLSAIGLAALLIPVSPDKKFSLFTLGVFSLVNCLALIVHYWLRDVNYSWKVILMSMIITAFIIDFSASIVMVFSKKESLRLEE